MNQNRMVGNSVYIRDLNQASIFSMIHRHGPISRKELANISNYSSATISNHVKTLLDNKYILEIDKGDSTGGRRPIYLSVNPSKAYILVMLIEVSKIEIMLFDIKFEIVSKKTFQIDDRAEKMINKSIIYIKEMLNLNQISEKRILGIGISFPGLIDRDSKSLVFAPNLGWQNVNVLKLIRKSFNFPVIVENEANAAALGEKVFGESEAKNLVYVSINEGVGCGIIINNRLYRGSNGNAGEFGHIIIDNAGQQCHCGNKGCWETISSETFIKNRVNSLSGYDLNIEEIYEKAHNSDQQITSILNTVGSNIGLGLVNIINALSPDELIIGGNIVKAEKFIKDAISLVIKENVLTIFSDKINIKFSELIKSAPSYGTAQMVFNKCFKIYDSN